MLLLKHILLLLIFTVFLQLFCSSQREVILTRAIQIYCPNISYYTNKCDYLLLVPTDIPGKQKILNYSYSTLKPDRVIKTATNEYYLNWKKISFYELSKNNLEANIKLKLYTYDLNTAKKKPIIDKADLDTSKYLAEDEENFRTNAKNIKEAATKIEGISREEITKSIFDFVIVSLDYKIFFYQDRGAKKALKDGEGDCTEYSELMVTLCRAKKIPARIVKGLIPKSSKSVGRHNWVEVFFPEYGWVAFDPTWADHPSATTTFYSMKNTYVQLSYRRFVKTINTSCTSGEVPFSVKLKDSCFDISSQINLKFIEMYTLYNNSESEKANTLLDTLLKLEPDNSVFWNFKGVALARLNNFDKGLEALNTSLKFAQDSKEKYQALYAFSNYYALKSDGENALKYLKQAIDLGFNDFNNVYKDPDFVKLKDYTPLWDYLEELKDNDD